MAGSEVIEHHSKLSDTEFEISFENGILDPAIFTHEAHLRMAWIFIKKYGHGQAVDKITKSLFEFVSRAGAAEKYSVTVTIAAIKMVDHFLRRTAAKDFQEFIGKNPRLKNQFRQLIASHYSFDVFASHAASKEYIEPDLLPFD